MSWFYAGGANNPLLTGLQAYWPLNEASGNSRFDLINGLELVEVSGVPVSTVAGAHGRLMARSPFGDSAHLDCVDNLIAVGDFDFTFAYTMKGTRANDAPNLAYWGDTGDALATSAIYVQGSVDTPGNSRTFIIYYKNGSDGNYLFLEDAQVAGGIPQDTPVTVVCYHDSVNNIIGMVSSINAEVTVARSGGVHPTNRLNICRSGQPATYGSDRNVQDFAFWNRVLTPAERAVIISGVDPMTILT